MKKSNAARLLERGGYTYTLHSYPVDREDLSLSHAAKQLGVPPGMLFKTLVTLNEKHQPIIAVVSGEHTLDLKALAQAAGCKKCTMLPMKEMPAVTGYVRGGCSPLGMKKLFPTFLDQVALEYERIWISAGVRGLQLALSPHALIEVLGAKCAFLGK